MYRRPVVLCLLSCISCFGAALNKDTAHLASYLKSLRRHEHLSGDEYQKVQAEYLAWIDIRLKAGADTAAMNKELRKAGLLSDGPETVEDYGRKYAGYLSTMETLPMRGANDLFAIQFGIHTGVGCEMDSTAILYRRAPLKRLAWLTAKDPATQEPYFLSGLDAGEDRPQGRVIATGWFASNCTSTWNGAVLRIDLLRQHSLKNVLNRDVGAKGGDESFRIRPMVKGDVATFQYFAAIGDEDLLYRQGVASYLTQSGKAIRLPPLALSMGGFIDEWLGITDDEAARFSSPDAAKMRKEIAREFQDTSFQWVRVAQCPGQVPAWEISIKPSESKAVRVFVLSAPTATRAKMLNISGQPSAACTEINISGDLTSVAKTLPW